MDGANDEVLGYTPVCDCAIDCFLHCSTTSQSHMELWTSWHWLINRQVSSWGKDWIIT